MKKNPALTALDTEDRHPRAEDVEERRRLEEGFSAGWGLHMQPSVKYWIDSHTHISETTSEEMLRAVRLWHDFQWGHRLRRHVALDGTPEQFEALAVAASLDDRLLWYCRLPWDRPDAELLSRCKTLGAIGLKLHNKTLMTGDFPRETPLSEKWQDVFLTAGKLHMPIVWHVTQRRSACPYTGGGKDSYWNIGETKGVSFSNHDLLADFLRIVEAHPETVFIGAHFLHIGCETLGALLERHPNLYTDTSVMGFLAYGDALYPQDAEFLRNFVLRYSNRILFGSDIQLSVATAETELLRQHFLGHIRWIKALQLPQKALSQVAYENFEFLFGLKSVDLFPTGFLRP